ncbi:uncharacterized protein LOC122631486 [Vespula pensylvanica]|uniref:Uncharacterized protein n=1 Tax=Vespula pensylvanica TaxID=30213 RepID=A0A834NYF9_VESPE|nr:uncharacterized protein LOC122631486 [Vespula pensylvanica]KAF7420509.1 hypothetical protein H0235_010806 [Vespula pensylvanica]
MEKATSVRVKQLGCECWKNKIPQYKRKQRDRCKRKRQTLVFNVNADDEIWHEPYMQRLQKEFSDVSILCDSKIELPWKDIALPTVVRKIRTDNSVDHGSQDAENGEVDLDEAEKKESNGFMTLPWHKLLITNVVTPTKETVPACCDSNVEIPWEDLALDKPVNIRVPPTDEKDSCVPDDLEIPWQDILVPQNIVIEVPKKICTMNSRKQKK